MKVVVAVLCAVLCSCSCAEIASGWDWTVPDYVNPSANSGFFSESASPTNNIFLKVVDLTWAQLNPAENAYSNTSTGSAQGMSFPSWNNQLAGSAPFWMRIWISSTQWAPAWVASTCGVSAITGEDYDGQRHLPIWNSCVWSKVLKLWREIFIQRNLRADPRLKLIYMPGAFTWCEFDFDMINNANDHDGLTFTTFNTWFQQAMKDMVNIFNGENSDPSDDYAYKLVFTGEDYPFGAFNGQADGLALDAVLKGTGIRTGITENFNFHLNHVPSYGTTINSQGYMITNETWKLFENDFSRYIIATENECYNACGYSTRNTEELTYAIRMSNLKALQMRVNWLYLVPRDSYMSDNVELYNFIRMSLGKVATNSFDAWVFLREFQDTYWVYDDSLSWTGKPWVKNYERWMIQRDVSPGGVTQRGTEIRTSVLTTDNGQSYEGRRTNHATGNDYIYFALHDQFLYNTVVPVEIKVTYADKGTASWRIEYSDAVGGSQNTESVTNTNSGTIKTASFTIANARFANSLSSNMDFRIYNGGQQDVEVQFVRVIKSLAPSATTSPASSSTAASSSTTASSHLTTAASSSFSTTVPATDDQSESEESGAASVVLAWISTIFGLLMTQQLYY